MDERNAMPDDGDPSAERPRELDHAGPCSNVDEPDVLMLELLVCPLTKAPLRYDREARELISDRAKLAYPIRGGVPVLLPSEARILDDAPGRTK